MNPQKLEPPKIKIQKAVKGQKLRAEYLNKIIEVANGGGVRPPQQKRRTIAGTATPSAYQTLIVGYIEYLSE